MNSSESPGRNGKNSPVSMKTTTTTPMSAYAPNRSIRVWGSSQLGPRVATGDMAAPASRVVITGQAYARGCTLPGSGL